MSTPKKPAQRSKPGPKPRPPNLNDLIRQRALHVGPPTTEDIQALLVSLLYDTPDVGDDISKLGKLKLDILMGLHKVNVDKELTKPEEDDGSNALKEALASRQKQRQHEAGRRTRGDDSTDP